MSDFSNATLLVTGASGPFGRLAVQHLLEAGATRVIAASRDTGKLADLAARGAELRRLDFDDAATLAPAFAGVDRVLLVSTDAVGRRRQQQVAAIDAAEQAGVSHIVYTSGPAAAPNDDSIIEQEHYWTEQKLAASSLGWTALRNHIYAEVILMGAAGAVQSGQLFDATEGRGRSYIWREDAARAAAGALLKANGQSILDVTGPAAVTQTEIAGLLATLSGRPVARIGLSAAELVAGLVAHGLPEIMAQALTHFDVSAAQGYHAVVTPVVENFSGSKPRDVATFLAANKAAFAG